MGSADSEFRLGATMAPDGLPRNSSSDTPPTVPAVTPLPRRQAALQPVGQRVQTATAPWGIIEQVVALLEERASHSAPCASVPGVATGHVTEPVVRAVPGRPGRVWRSLGAALQWLIAGFRF